MRKYFLAALLMSFSNLVSAGFYTGNDLKNYLDESKYNKGSFQSGLYGGYITGVHDALDGIVICSPDGTTIGQIKAVVAKYLEANPEAWNKPADFFVTSALKQAFPCK